MTDRPDLMIGDFARRSRLPISTLRYYDKIGLLTPAAIDPSSGYRSYSADQLPSAVLISRLRSLGISPPSIAQIVAGGLSAATVLHQERQRLTQEIEIGRDRLLRLDEFLSEAPSNDYRVEFLALAAREVAAHSYRSPAEHLVVGVTRAIVGLRSSLRRGQLQRTGAWGATFPVDLVEEVVGLVFAPIDQIGDFGQIDAVRLPAASVATTVHQGSLETLPSAYGAVFSALDDRGAVPEGPVTEEYLALDEPDSPPRLIRICIPYRESGDRAS